MIQESSRCTQGRNTNVGSWPRIARTADPSASSDTTARTIAAAEEMKGKEKTRVVEGRVVLATTVAESSLVFPF